MWRRLLAFLGVLAVAGALLSISAGPHESITSIRVSMPYGTRLSGLRFGSRATDYIDLKYPDVAPVGVVVWFHGGGWIAGGRATAFTHDVPMWLVSQGWVLASVEYRLTRAVSRDDVRNVFPAAINDAQRATRWIISNRERLGIPKRTILAGASAGGNLALVSAIATADVSGVPGGSPRVDGVLSIVGPTDIDAMYRTFLPVFSAAAALYAGCDISVIDGNFHACAAQREFITNERRAGVAWNLVHAVAAGESIPPCYLIGGSRDPLVNPVEQIDPIVPLWRNAAGDSSYAMSQTIANIGHNMHVGDIDTVRLAAWLRAIARGGSAGVSHAAIR